MGFVKSITTMVISGKIEKIAPMLAAATENWFNLFVLGVRTQETKISNTIKFILSNKMTIAANAAEMVDPIKKLIASGKEVVETYKKIHPNMKPLYEELSTTFKKDLLDTPESEKQVEEMVKTIKKIAEELGIELPKKPQTEDTDPA